MMIRNRHFAITGTLIVGALALGACAGDESTVNVVEGAWDDVVAAANDEGRVNLYSVAPPAQNDRLVAAFRENYPEIDVTVTRGAGELPGRVESEIQSDTDGADVLLFSDPQFFVTIADHLLEIDGPNVEGWKEDFWIDEGVAIIPTMYPWTMLVWNSEIFPEGFSSWDDLLAPEVTGRLGVYREPTISNASTLTFMENELGPEYLEVLGEQDPRYYASVVPMNQAIASGEIGVTYLATPSIVDDLKSQGAPIEHMHLDPGFGLMWGGGAIATSHRPNAARVFLDFVMSEEGQTAINGDGLGAAGRDGIDGAVDMEGWDLFDSSQMTPDRLAEMEDKIRQWFG